jgi:biotin carboxyl carrier protein
LAIETIEAPLPGKIIQVNVGVGSRVKEGDALCTLESMKMENPILSPVSGVVKAVQVSPAQVVKAGNIIAVIEY